MTSKLPEKRAEHPPVPVSGAAAPPVSPVNVDVYLRAGHSPFSNRTLLLAFLLATPLLCLMVYLLGHFNTSGLGLERDIRNARDRATLERFSQRIAASANRDQLAALVQIQTTRLLSRDLLASESPPGPAELAELALSTRGIQTAAYPEDARKLIEEQSVLLEDLARRPAEFFSSRQLGPLLDLLRAMRWHLDTLASPANGPGPEALAASIEVAERQLVLNTLAMPAEGLDSRAIVAAVAAADIEHSPTLLALQNTSQDPHSFLNTVLAQYSTSPQTEQSALSEITVLPGLSVRELLLGKHVSSAPVPGNTPAEFATLALFRNALAKGAGPEALRYAAAASKLWSGYDSVLATIETQLVNASAARELNSLPGEDDQAGLEEARRWLLAQQANMEGRAAKEDVSEAWKSFVTRILRDTDPKRESALADVQRRLDDFLGSPASMDAPETVVAALLQQYEEALAEGVPADPELHAMLQLAQQVQLPLMQWLRSGGEAPLDLALQGMWTLFRQTPEVAGSVDDILPGHDTQWRFTSMPLRGVLLTADDDLYKEAAPSPEEITTDQIPVAVEWAAIGSEEHFLYLQELGAALWLAIQIESRRGGSSEELSDAADGARLPLPSGQQDRVLAGQDAFATMLMQALPLPIRAGVQSDWLHRRAQHPRYQARTILFDSFQFAESLSHSSEFYAAFDVSPVFHPAFFRALEQLRVDIPDVLKLAPEQAGTARTQYPREAAARGALQEALDGGALSAQPLIDLVRAESLLSTFVREGWLPPRKNLAGEWAVALPELLPLEAIGKASDADDLFSRLELSPDWPLWRIDVFEQPPRSFVQTARTALACWGYLGMHYGEGEGWSWSGTPFNQLAGDDGFEEKFRANRDAAPELFSNAKSPKKGG